MHFMSILFYYFYFVRCKQNNIFVKIIKMNKTRYIKTSEILKTSKHSVDISKPYGLIRFIKYSNEYIFNFLVD